MTYKLYINAAAICTQSEPNLIPHHTEPSLFHLQQFPLQISPFRSQNYNSTHCNKRFTTITKYQLKTKLVIMDYKL